MTDKKIMIVDDSETDRMILREILNSDFQVMDIDNGYKAIDVMVNKKQLPDCLLLDINMPVIDGFQVLRLMAVNGIRLPVFLTTAEATKENVARAAEFRINGFIAKPFKKDAVLNRMRSFFNVKIENKAEKVETKVIREINAETVTATNELIRRMTIYYGDILRHLGVTDAKYKRVSALVAILLRRHAALTKDPVFDEEHIAVTSQAVYFYDIGITAIPHEVRRISEEEVTGSPEHTLAGARLVSLNTSPLCRFFVDMCADICLHHHEYADGSGFPHGRRASEVRIPAQLTGFMIEFDRLFLTEGNYDSLSCSFVINSLVAEKGRYSEYMIKLLTDCEDEIISYYRTLPYNTGI